MNALPEPWLRGPLAGVPSLLTPVFYSFIQAREDLAVYTQGLTTAQLWATPYGGGSVGFHIRHIARSTDRLMTYLQDLPLSEEQFAGMKREKDAGASREELLAELDRNLAHAEAVIRSIDPSSFSRARYVGRKRLPSTVIGLLTHIAEHTQRHIGLAIGSARAAKDARPA